MDYDIKKSELQLTQSPIVTLIDLSSNQLLRRFGHAGVHHLPVKSPQRRNKLDHSTESSRTYPHVYGTLMFSSTCSELSPVCNFENASLHLRFFVYPHITSAHVLETSRIEHSSRRVLTAEGRKSLLLFFACARSVIGTDRWYGQDNGRLGLVRIKYQNTRTTPKVANRH